MELILNLQYRVSPPFPSQPASVLAAPPGACEQEIPTLILIRVERAACWWEFRAQPCLHLLLFPRHNVVPLSPREARDEWHPHVLLTVGVLTLCPVLWGSQLCLRDLHKKCPFAEPKAVKEKPLDGWSGPGPFAGSLGWALCLFSLCLLCYLLI